MQFICQKNKREVELAVKENKEIKKAKEEYEYLTGDAAQRRLAFLRDKAIRDEKNMVASAKEEGMKEGMEEGIKEGIEKSKMIMAKRLLKEKMTIEQIVKITELSEEEIEKLKSEN